MRKRMWVTLTGTQVALPDFLRLMSSGAEFTSVLGTATMRAHDCKLQSRAHVSEEFCSDRLLFMLRLSLCHPLFVFGLVKADQACEWLLPLPGDHHVLRSLHENYLNFLSGKDDSGDEER